MRQGWPCETKQLTLELCSEVEMPVHFNMYVLQIIKIAQLHMDILFFFSNQGWGSFHTGTVTIDSNCCRIPYQFSMNIVAAID
jgi:hypothetical protein